MCVRTVDKRRPIFCSHLQFFVGHLLQPTMFRPIFVAAYNFTHNSKTRNDTNHKPTHSNINSSLEHLCATIQQQLDIQTIFQYTNRNRHTHTRFLYEVEHQLRRQRETSTEWGTGERKEREALEDLCTKLF